MLGSPTAPVQMSSASHITTHSVPHVTLNTVTSVSNSSVMTSGGLDKLPIAHLTPGPSPTATIAVTETTPTSVPAISSVSCDNEDVHSSYQKQAQRTQHQYYQHHHSSQQNQPSHTHSSQQPPVSQAYLQHSQMRSTQHNQINTSQHHQHQMAQQPQFPPSSLHQPASQQTSTIKKTVAWAKSTDSQNSGLSSDTHSSDVRGGHNTGQSNNDSIC